MRGGVCAITVKLKVTFQQEQVVYQAGANFQHFSQAASRPPRPCRRGLGVITLHSSASSNVWSKE